VTSSARSHAQALEAVVAAMDRLRSPGGCPWDAEQTHRSLAPYAVEEAYELAEAAESDDRAGLRGELGDVLLQVLFHARIAEEHPDEPFDLSEVAQELHDKLVRRHPHVFGGAEGVTSAEQVEEAWDQIKQRERAGASVLAGIPLALPALARAQKVARRLRRTGISDAELLGGDGPAVAPAEAGRGARPAVGGGIADPATAVEQADPTTAVGAELMALVLRAERLGVDAEAALRAHVRHLTEHHYPAGPSVGGPGPSGNLRTIVEPDIPDIDIEGDTRGQH